MEQIIYEYKAGYNAGVAYADGRANANSANYKAGYNAGVAAADARSNPNSANYKAGYNAGLAEGKSQGSMSGEMIIVDRSSAYTDENGKIEVYTFKTGITGKVLWKTIACYPDAVIHHQRSGSSHSRTTVQGYNPSTGDIVITAGYGGWDDIQSIRVYY